jgi:hypothetical protein
VNSTGTTSCTRASASTGSLVYVTCASLKELLTSPTS